MRTRRSAPLLLAVAAMALSTPTIRAGNGRGPSAIKWEEGARAAADTWPQEDGCPARTGCTETKAMTGPREVAWRFTVQGEVEGEPLAWKGSTFVVARAGTKRTLHVLATATGVERYKKTFDTLLPLSPCIQDGRVVLRTTPRTVHGFTLGERGLVARWTVTAKSAIGPPVAVRDDVYVVVDGVLERRTYGSTAPMWPKA